jgi:hypothetical protein
MKKAFFSTLLLTTLILGACGNSGDNADATDKSSKSSSSSVVKVESSESETTGDFVSSADKATFDGTILKGNTYTIKITDHKVIQPGEKGNEYGQKPVIAFWYDTLVAADYDNSLPIDPTSAWITNFEAVQDSDPNAVTPLNIATLPDDQYLNTQTSTIKPGGTVSNAVAYELTDDSAPVTLTAKSFTKEFGKVDFQVK